MAEIEITLTEETPEITVEIVASGPVGPQGPQGPQGEQGEQGETGPAGADGAAGQDGADGADGADGVSPEVTIAEITGGHSVTITDADHPTGQTFNVMDGADGQDGAPGQDGADGQDGTDGTDGVSPEVTITTITGGHRVAITDADHPTGQSFDVMDGADGQDGQDGQDGVGVPSGGTTGQVLKKASGTDYDTEWADESGGGGTSDYSDLTNKPSIESVTLSGNKTAADLGLAKASDIPTVPSAATATPSDLGTAAVGSSSKYAKEDHVHNKPTYSKSDVGLGNVDNVQQYSASNPPPYPVTSVNGSTGAVVLDAEDVGALPDSTSIPTKTSDLTNDSGFITSAPVQSVNGKTGTVMLTASDVGAKPSSYAAPVDSVNGKTGVVVLSASDVGAGTYSKPSGGIPSTDLASAVQTSLGKADTALQSYTETDPTVPSWAKASSKPSYTKSEVGLGNVDNVQQYSASNPPPYPVSSVNGQTGVVSLSIPSTAADVGAEPAVTEVTVSTAGAVSQALDPGKLYHFTGAMTSLTITLNAASSGQIAEYHFDFLSGSTAPTLTMPNTVTMPDSFTVEASKRYEVDVLNNFGAVVSWANS